MKRRSILQAGAMAIGAVLLPRAAGAATLTNPKLSGADDLRGILLEKYLARVQHLADELRDSFVGVPEEDEDDGREVERAAGDLEAECKAEFCRTEDEARLCWALSPSWEYDEISAYCDVTVGASVIVAADVARAMGNARLIEWYTNPFASEVRS